MTLIVPLMKTLDGKHELVHIGVNFVIITNDNQHSYSLLNLSVFYSKEELWYIIVFLKEYHQYIENPFLKLYNTFECLFEYFQWTWPKSAVTWSY